ncbi:MAG TPA: LPS export ABC transporter permease LptF [Burkholderiaceae bacterium]|jgi:lipopolysaccharide export system permease protein
MIFQRALRRELGSTAGAVFTALFTITITSMLIRILGQAAGGKVASQDVVSLIAFAALNYLPVILIPTCFISVLTVVTRSYQDSEMVVWFASGLSLTRWIRPVLRFGMPNVVLVALLSFFITPWANQQSTEFRERFEKREDIAKVSPGKFQESSSSDRVFFAEATAGNEMKLKNIFIDTWREGHPSVIVAKEGSTELDQHGDKLLVLQKGRRYDGEPAQTTFQMMEFESYGVLVSRESRAAAGDKSARSLPTKALLEDPNNFNRGELLWRISLPLMCLLLTLLAIPLSFVNPRGGRSVNMIVALLLFFVYTNMVNVFQAMVVQQRLSLAAAWWPIHLLALMVIIGLFLWRLQMNHRYHPLALWGAMKRAILFRRAASK